MAISKLKNIKKIDGFEVLVMDQLRQKYPEKFNESGSMDYEWFEKQIRPNKFIYVRNDVNSISFTIQNGPVKQNGVNGCQVDTLISTAQIMIEQLNKDYPCQENEQAIDGLETALIALRNRKHNREIREVQGYDEK